MFHPIYLFCTLSLWSSIFVTTTTTTTTKNKNKNNNIIFLPVTGLSLNDYYNNNNNKNNNNNNNRQQQASSSSSFSSSFSNNRLLQLLSEIRNDNDKSKTKSALPLIGVHDALSARIFQQVYNNNKNNNNYNNINNNNHAFFVSGFGVSAARLGVPDAGILTRTDLLDTVQQIILTTQYNQNQNNNNQNSIIIVDGDTGFGGSPNIRQTIRQLAALGGCGVAAISIEDQIFPKKCTYVAGSGITVVSQEHAKQRIRTAMAAQQEVYEQTGNLILIIARTDCRMQLGMEQVIARCCDFDELGANIVYAENLQSMEEYQQLRSYIDAPMIMAQVQNVDTNNNTNNNRPPRKYYTLQEIASLGYEMGLFGVTGLQATVAALQSVAHEMIRGDGLVRDYYKNNNMNNNNNQDNVSSLPLSLASLEDIKKVVGFDDLNDFEANYNCN